MPRTKATKKTTKTSSKVSTKKSGEARSGSARKATKKEDVIVVPAPSAEKQEVITQFQVKLGDTGSPEVQAALLTKRIEKLVMHLKSNPSDNHSRRGLLGIVSKRRRLLNYLEKKDDRRYKMIAAKLGLSK